jgi:serine/threonine protein kinase
MELQDSKINFNTDNYALFIIKNSSYIPLENISKQGCFPVYLSKHKLKKDLYYVNVASLTVSNRFYLEQHIKVNKLLNNYPLYFVSLVEHFEMDNTFYIVLEHLDCYLNDFLQKEYVEGMPEMVSFFFFHQIFFALKQLHQLNIVHRDLKLGRILFKNYQLKITGFSYSYLISNDNKLNKVYNQDIFIAPEIESFIKIGSNPFKIDTYSLGIILYTLLLNQVPDDVYTIRKNLDLNKNKLSQDVRDLILNCISENVETRYGTKEIEDSKWYKDSVEFYESVIKDKDLDYSTKYNIIVKNINFTISSDQ